MCTTCGCGAEETHLEGDTPPQPERAQGDGTQGHQGDPAHPHEHVLPDGSILRHMHTAGGDHSHGAAHEHVHVHADGTAHSHVHVHHGDHAHAHSERTTEVVSAGLAGAHALGMSQSRMVQIEQDILAKNDQHAARNRQFLADRGVLALNLVSSPGSGKTTVLVRTIEALKGRIPVAVIEGDQQTTHDADRIRATGVAALQINTGKGCHLDASMVERALDRLRVADDSVLFIENVGNLVCPASFDLGEADKVVVLSVTEGEDKPLKYPDMFRAASLMLLNKVDLLPHVEFDIARCVEYARRINPAIEVIRVSATTGEGFDAWSQWLDRRAGATRAQRLETVTALRRRVAELEAQLTPPARPL